MSQPISVQDIDYEICLQIRVLHPLFPSLRHSSCPQWATRFQTGCAPCTNGKFAPFERENLFPAQGKFFLSPEKKFSLPSTLDTPSPSPACALQTHAPVPRHTATHARRRVMRKITTSHASATIPNDDDDTDDNGVCAEQVPRPCGSSHHFQQL